MTAAVPFFALEGLDIRGKQTLCVIEEKEQRSEKKT